MRRRDFFLTASLAAAQQSAPFDVLVNGKSATSLYPGAEFDKPFLYPIRTPAGHVLSRGFPISPVEGESNDHGWHRGFFYGHGIINGQDFWRELGHEKASRLVSAPHSISNARGVLSFASDMVIPSGATIGKIAQQYTINAESTMYAMEVSITIEANRGQPLVFGDTDDGGFAFRLSDSFREDRGARLSNSEGLTGTAKMWGQPARWVHYEADLPTGSAGVAVLDHPSNLRHPTRWHARGYSLCAANPFALRSFTKDQSSDGSFTITAGKSLRLRYLVLIHDGALPAKAVEQRYRQFAG